MIKMEVDMKKIICCAICMMLMAVTAGCGNSQRPEEQPKDTPVTETEDESVPEGTAADSGETDGESDGNTERGEISVVLTIDDREIPAVIYDSKAGRSVINGLPYAVHLSKGATDFCGDIGVDFAYDESDLQDGVKKGDLVYWIPGDDMTIFFDEFPPTGNDDSEIVSIGRILDAEDADFVINYPGNVLDIDIRLAE